MHFSLLTALPQVFRGWSESGVIGRAIEQQIFEYQLINLRDFAAGNYQQIDDAPYGGGPGMVMQLNPIMQAIAGAKQQHPDVQIHLMAPEGRQFTCSDINSWLEHPNHLLVCGRYQGIDERFIQQVQPQIWSIGDLVLSGGELAAMMIIESIARHIPGVLGNQLSANLDSFANPIGLLDYPHYTRPESFRDLKIPAVLKSGNHQQIANWRNGQQTLKSWEYRPDLLRGKLDQSNLAAVRETYQQRIKRYISTIEKAKK